MNRLNYYYNRFKIYFRQKYFLKSSRYLGRPSSFPFLSGDTYRSIADIIIETAEQLELFEKLIYNYKNIKCAVYISGNLIESSELLFTETIIRLQKTSSKLNINLILHDYDKKINSNIINILSDLFNEIFLINYTETGKNIINIPIGLENFYYNRGGISEYYQDYKNDKYLKEIKKNNMIFAAFNIFTNYQERSQLKLLIESSGYKFSGASLPTEIYINNIKNSYFTLSPEGNGSDCHRTWEAIYLDCIPVIKKNVISDELSSSLPILVVEKWEDFLFKSEEELMCIYRSIISRNPYKAYAPYWMDAIRKIHD
ncbi:hypothetical protein G6678_01740 [Polynucleobacter paneuropaeus]|nr:hypothetical protein G6678_01740 [Polynucleobacter paneuropaeus]